MGSGAGVGGRGKWRRGPGGSGERRGEGASHWLSGGSSRDEVDLGPGFPPKIDLNRDKGGNENSPLVCREVTAEQHHERTGRELGVLSVPPFCPPGGGPVYRIFCGVAAYAESEESQGCPTSQSISLNLFPDSAEGEPGATTFWNIPSRGSCRWILISQETASLRGPTEATD